MFGLKETMFEFGKNLGSKVHLSKRAKPEAKSLAGQVILVTGANRGMGKIVAEDCAARGARVVMGCRDLAAAAKAIDDIRTRNPAADVVACQLDLSSFASVQAFANSVTQNEKKIDVLVNNAAIITHERSMTADGHETSIQVNYYSPVLLTLLLTPFMERTSSDARIVTVGAVGHAFIKDIGWQDMESVSASFAPFAVYLHSKLAIMLFVRELAVRKSANRGARVYCVDPGISPTELATGGNQGLVTRALTAAVKKSVFRSVQQSADSIVSVIVKDKEGYNPRSYYFMDGIEKGKERVLLTL